MSLFETTLKKGQIKNSRISEDFDWSIYDKIAARYGDEQPRGGVVGNPKFTLGIDSYDRGCVHNSIHQFQATRKNLIKAGYWNRPMPFPVNINLIEKAMKKAKGTLTFGVKSDGFMWMDLRYKITLETLKLARAYGVKLRIETMSDLVSRDEYIDLIKGHVVVMNMGAGNCEQERIDSPGAPSVLRRALACRKLLNEADITVEVRTATLEPRPFTATEFYLKAKQHEAKCLRVERETRFKELSELHKTGKLETGEQYAELCHLEATNILKFQRVG